MDTTAAPTQMMTPAPATTARATDAPTNAPATTQSDGGGTDGDIVTVGGTTAAGQGSTTDGVGGTSEGTACDVLYSRYNYFVRGSFSLGFSHFYHDENS